MNSKNCLFSIVTVCLNAGVDLSATANSVLGQTWKNFEYIIKDGLSTDGSIEGLSKDNRCQIVSMKDTGIFDAMNQALSLVKGDFVVFLNAGDLFFAKDTLEDVAEIIQRHPQVEFFYGHIRKLESRKGYEFYPKRLSRYFLYTNGLCHQAWFVSVKLYYRLGGFDPNFPIGSDYTFLLKAVLEAKAKTCNIDRIVAVYKGSGVSSDRDLALRSDAWRQAAREKYFTRTEVFTYKFIYGLRKFAKMICYDTILYRFVSRLYELRVSNSSYNDRYRR